MKYGLYFWQEVFAYMDAGHTVQEACVAFHVSSNAIYKRRRVLQQYGVLVMPPKPSQKRARSRLSKLDPEALQAYVQAHPNATQQEIAIAFSCSQGLVNQTLKKHAIPYQAHRGFASRPHKLDPDALRAYMQEHPDSTQLEMANAFSCSQGLVNQTLKKYQIPHKGIEDRRVRAHKLDAEALRVYVQEHPGSTQLEMATVFSCSQGLINQTLKKYNIPYKSSVTWRSRPHKLDPDALRAYMQEHPDATQLEMANALSCSQGLIYQTLKKYDIPHKSTREWRSRPHKLDPEALRAYIQEHPDATQSAMADAFSCSQGLINQTLKKYDIPHRRRQSTRV